MENDNLQYQWKFNLELILIIEWRSWTVVIKLMSVIATNLLI